MTAKTALQGVTIARDFTIKRRHNLAPQMARQPIFAYEGEGDIFLLDGLQRAQMAFDQGLEVEAYVIAKELALNIGMDEERERPYRLLDATRTQPVGVVRGQAHDNTIVQIRASTDLKREGQPLSKQERGLRDLIYLKTIYAVSYEIAIVDRWSRFASIRLDRRGHAEISREQQILDAWRTAYEIPVAPPWKACANEAKRLLTIYSNHDGKPALDHAIQMEIRQQGRAAAVRRRDMEIKDRNCLLKALHQAKNARSFGIDAVKLDDKYEDATAIDKARTLFRNLPIWGNLQRIAKEAKHLFATTGKKQRQEVFAVSLDEQIYLSKAYGINPTDFCFDYTRLDALFEAYIYSLHYKTDGRLPSSPAMVEAFLQRHAIAKLVGQRQVAKKDKISPLWDDLFKYYDESGMSDVINRETLREMDRKQMINGPIPDNWSQRTAYII